VRSLVDALSFLNTVALPIAGWSLVRTDLTRVGSGLRAVVT
jgi:hypothetical protein